jgi:hypothetical protein
MTSTEQRLAEIEAQEKELAVEKAKLLAESKEADLETVRRLCKLHGFTATQLQGYLMRNGKNDGSVVGDESQPKVKRKYTKRTVATEVQNS